MTDRFLTDLLRDARSGHTESLARLCEMFYPRVLKYMRYRVDAASAEDLTGEVFLRVLGHVAEQKGSFVAWLYRIAANVVTDHGRAKATRKETTLDEDNAKTVRTAEVHSEVSDRQMDLESAIAALTDDQRELITLKFTQGLSNFEIAGITGRSPEAIRILQFRALMTLRKILDTHTENTGRAH